MITLKSSLTWTSVPGVPAERKRAFPAAACSCVCLCCEVKTFNSGRENASEILTLYQGLYVLHGGFQERICVAALSQHTAASHKHCSQFWGVELKIHIMGPFPCSLKSGLSQSAH